MSNPTAAMLVIGDEILSGRTRDSNSYHLAGALSDIGIDLTEIRVVGDTEARIVAALREFSDQYDLVFTCGGIGPTHDDITADAVGAAFGVPVDVNENARKLLADYYEETGRELNAARLRMARTPNGAELIENPVSVAPGFRLQNVYVMAGIPSVFQAMLAGVLAGLDGGQPLESRSLRLTIGEGDIAAPLGALAQKFPDLSFGSYPYNHEGVHGANVLVRGRDRKKLDQAFAELHSLFPDGTA